MGDSFLCQIVSWPLIDIYINLKKETVIGLTPGWLFLPPTHCWIPRTRQNVRTKNFIVEPLITSLAEKWLKNLTGNWPIVFAIYFLIKRVYFLAKQIHLTTFSLPTSIQHFRSLKRCSRGLINLEIQVLFSSVCFLKVSNLFYIWLNQYFCCVSESVSVNSC